MVKKILALAGAGALLLGMAGPAFGLVIWHKDVAIVDNSAVSVADTGGNSQSDSASVKAAMYSSANAGSSGSRSITTGGASSYAGALVVANTHIGCGLCDGDPLFSKDIAFVRNEAVSGAFTGDNAQDDEASVRWAIGSSAYTGSSGSRGIGTGPASSTARAWTIVNTHWGY